MHRKQLCEPVPDVVFLVSVKETISDVKHWQLGRLRGLAGGGFSRPTPGGGGWGVWLEVSRPTPGGGGGWEVRGLQTHTWGVSQHALRQMPPSPADGYCCGRYASYWNAFLFIYITRFEPSIRTFECRRLVRGWWLPSLLKELRIIQQQPPCISKLPY